jgi:hypothetical protein
VIASRQVRLPLAQELRFVHAELKGANSIGALELAWNATPAPGSFASEIHLIPVNDRLTLAGVGTEGFSQHFRPSKPSPLMPVPRPFPREERS